MVDWDDDDDDDDDDVQVRRVLDNVDVSVPGGQVKARGALVVEVVELRRRVNQRLNRRRVEQKFNHLSHNTSRDTSSQ